MEDVGTCFNLADWAMQFELLQAYRAEHLVSARNHVKLFQLIYQEDSSFQVSD